MYEVYGISFNNTCWNRGILHSLFMLVEYLVCLAYVIMPGVKIHARDVQTLCYSNVLLLSFYWYLLNACGWLGIHVVQFVLN
jgi:hypothetical protein